MEIDDDALRSAESHDLDALLADSPDRSYGSDRMMGRKPDPPGPADDHDYYNSEGYYHDNEKRVEYEPALIEQHQLNLLHNPEEDEEDAVSVDSTDIPDSLRTYVEQAEENLRQTRADWRSPLGNGTLRPETPASALAHVAIPPPTEDDDDERFKEEVMAKFNHGEGGDDEEEGDDDQQIHYEVPALQDPPIIEKQSTIKKQDPAGSNSPSQEVSSSPPKLQPPMARKSTSPTHHPVEYSPTRRDQLGTTRGVTPTTLTTASSTRSTGSNSTKTSKIKALSSSSRLLQPTSSQLAQSKTDQKRIGAGVDVEASRRAAQERVRERQERLRKEQASQEKRRTTSTSGSEFQAARIAARERVRDRQQKMRQTDERKKASAEKRQVSAEEGLARARARVKIRKMQEQRSTAKGKENTSLNGDGAGAGLKSPPGVRKSPARPLTIPKGPKLSTSKRPRALPQATHEKQPHEKTTPIRRSTGPTRPVSPKFATSKRASLRNAANAMGARADDTKSMKSAQSAKSAKSAPSSGSSLRQSHVSPMKRSTTVPQAPKFVLDKKYGERKRPPAAKKEIEPRMPTKTSRRKVTIAKAPKFALDQKYGEVKKPPPEKKREPQAHVSSSTSMRRTVTIPEAPKFALDQKYGERKTIPKRAADDKSLAATAYSFEHQLRASDDSVNPVRKSRGGVTKPVSPKFHEAHKRKLPKSSEELELEEIERYRKNPFKAKPVPTSPQAEICPKQTRSQRPLTKPVAPKFHEMHHGKTTAETAREVLERSRRKDKIDEKNEHSRRNRKLTVPKEFHFHTASKRAPPKSHEEVDEEEMKKQFHARRMPSHNKTKSVQRKSSRVQTSPPRIIETRDPLIERAASFDSPMRQNENSSQAPDPPEISPDRPKSQTRSPTKDSSDHASRIVHYAHNEASPSAVQVSPLRATPKSAQSAGSRSRNTSLNEESKSASLTKVKPFSFQTEARADAKKQRSAEKAREAAKERIKVNQKKSPRETKVKPFNFQTDARAEAKKNRDAEKALDIALEQQDPQEQDATPFRARTVPKSDYSKKVSPKETAASQARKLAHSKSRDSSQNENKTPPFKARSIRTSLSSPRVRQTAASLARIKMAESSKGEPETKASATRSGKRAPGSTTPWISPKETRASLARRKQGEAVRSAKPGETPITQKSQPVVPPFKAREVPATMTSPPTFSPRETALSKARREQAAAVKTMSPKKGALDELDEAAPLSPSFKARKVPASLSSPPRVSPRETATSATRKTLASLSPSKKACEKENDTVVNVFHARPVPDSIKSPPSLSPRETTTSIARSKLSSPNKALTFEVNHSNFKAKPSPRYLSSPPSVSPRETASSLARKKHGEAVRLKKELDEKEKVENEVVEDFKARPMPSASSPGIPMETRASKARRAAAESKKDGDYQNESPPFKARAVPASTYTSPPATSPRETVTSSARKKILAESNSSESAATSPKFKAKPIPQSTFSSPSSSPRQTATSALRQKLASHQVDEKHTPFKAKPPPSSTYSYEPISSFEKPLPSSSSYEEEEPGVVVLPDVDDPGVGSLLGSQAESENDEEDNEIEFTAEEGYEQAELFVQDGPEHTIDFTQPEVDDDEDDFSVGQILGSVNDPSANGYANHDHGTPRSHRSVEV